MDREIIKAMLSCAGLSAGGCSVTQRIKQVKQPLGGYINPKEMDTVVLGDGNETLNQNETTSPNLVGQAVDYMTRFMLGTPADKAFGISMKGAELINEEKTARKLINSIKGLDNNSIINAVKLSGFDVCYRAGIDLYKPIDEIVPDPAAIENIITMVNRSLNFFDNYGPRVLDGFDFIGGYTDTISRGDGDFLTNDTLWDFKVSKSPVKKEHTLQLLIYWRMGVHSIYPEFYDISYLGIYNPRLNTVSRISVTDIPDDVIKAVEKDVIGYKE